METTTEYSRDSRPVIVSGVRPFVSLLTLTKAPVGSDVTVSVPAEARVNEA